MSQTDLFLDFGEGEPSKAPLSEKKTRGEKKTPATPVSHPDTPAVAPAASAGNHKDNAAPAKGALAVGKTDDNPNINNHSTTKKEDITVQSTKQKEHKQYSPEEIMKSSVEYFHGDELAANVWMNKYALRDEDKIYELNPDMMHRRLAGEFARIEARYPNPMSEETIYELLKDFKYIVPQGSPMRGVGNDIQIETLTNC